MVLFKYVFITETDAMPATAATPSVLNIKDPITVPSPMSESITNVLIILVKNSGVVVAVDIVFLWLVDNRVRTRGERTGST